MRTTCNTAGRHRPPHVLFRPVTSPQWRQRLDLHPLIVGPGQRDNEAHAAPDGPPQSAPEGHEATLTWVNLSNTYLPAVQRLRKAGSGHYQAHDRMVRFGRFGHRISRRYGRPYSVSIRDGNRIGGACVGYCNSVSAYSVGGSYFVAQRRRTIPVIPRGSV